jgi:hypothetical protein
VPKPNAARVNDPPELGLPFRFSAIAQRTGLQQDKGSVRHQPDQE